MFKQLKKEWAKYLFMFVVGSIAGTILPVTFGAVFLESIPWSALGAGGTTLLFAALDSKESNV